MSDVTLRAQVLAEALPYIQKYYGKTIVIKYGGSAMISRELREAVIGDVILLSLVGIHVVVVHGGGPEISAMLKKLGKESRFVDGLRCTDAETMDVVQQVLCGKVNKNLAATLNRRGGRAIGLCGLDAGLFQARLLDAKYGLVGELARVDPAPVRDCLTAGYIPVVSTVAQGMDAVKMGNELTYSHMGQICIGIPQHEPQKEAMLEAVTELFERTGLPYTREPDILRRLWCKWMLNVGVNQAVMVEEGTYGTVQRPGPARQMMKAAMAEVVELAGREGIRVTMEDLDAYVDLIDSLNPDGMPSMRQDGLARRPSEVEFFAGTVIRRAEAAGLDVPVNRELYRRIKGMESGYPV